MREVIDEEPDLGRQMPAACVHRPDIDWRVVELGQYSGEYAGVECRFEDEIRPEDYAHSCDCRGNDQIAPVRLQRPGHAHVVVAPLLVGEAPDARIRSIYVRKKSMAGEIGGRAWHAA